MKKKKVTLERKLSLNKEMLAQLSAGSMEQVAGGATRLMSCNMQCESFATIPPGGHYCQLCP